MGGHSGEESSVGGGKEHGKGEAHDGHRGVGKGFLSKREKIITSNTERDRAFRGYH